MNQSGWNPNGTPGDQAGGDANPWSQQGAAEAWRDAPPPTVESPAGQPAPPMQPASAQPPLGGPPSAPAWDQPQPGYPYSTPGMPAAGMPPAGAVVFDPSTGTTMSVDNPNKKTGMVGLILSCAALVIGLVSTILGAQSMVRFAELLGPEAIRSGQEIDASTASPEAQQAAVVMMACLFVWSILCSGLGIAGLVVCGTQLKWPSQRKFALPGLIIALVAPVVTIIIFFTMVAPIFST